MAEGGGPLYDAIISSPAPTTAPADDETMPPSSDEETEIEWWWPWPRLVLVARIPVSLLWPTTDDPLRQAMENTPCALDFVPAPDRSVACQAGRPPHPNPAT